jgi:hypothetical protein
MIVLRKETLSFKATNTCEQRYNVRIDVLLRRLGVTVIAGEKQ